MWKVEETQKPLNKQWGDGKTFTDIGIVRERTNINAMAAGTTGLYI